VLRDVLDQPAGYGRRGRAVRSMVGQAVGQTGVDSGRRDGSGVGHSGVDGGRRDGSGVRHHGVHSGSGVPSGVGHWVGH